jgi:hypothetical protein
MYWRRFPIEKVGRGKIRLAVANSRRQQDNRHRRND